MLDIPCHIDRIDLRYLQFTADGCIFRLLCSQCYSLVITAYVQLYPPALSTVRFLPERKTTDSRNIKRKVKTLEYGSTQL